MVDFARLSIGVDTADLTKGEAALGSITAAGARAEKSTVRMSDQFGRFAKVAETGFQAAGNDVDGFARQTEEAAARVGAAATQMDRATGAATSNLTFQLQDIAMMLAAGQSPFLLAMQQGTQVSAALSDMNGRVGVLRGLSAAFMSLISPINLITIGVIGFGAAAVQSFFSADGAAGKLRTTLDGMAEAINGYANQFDAVKTAQDDVTEASRRYNEVLGMSKALQGSDFGAYLGFLGKELNARRELLAVEKTRLELRRLELQESIRRGQEKINALTAEQEIFTTLNRSYMTEQEIAAARAIQLQRTQETVAANQELFATQREQQATLALIDALLGQSNGKAEEQVQTHQLITQSLASQYQLYAQTRAEGERIAASAQAQIAAYQQQAQLNDLIARYGADSYRVAVARFQQERAIVEAKALEAGHSRTVVNEILRAFDATNRTLAATSGLQGFLNNAAAAAGNLASQLAAAARALPFVGGAIGGFIDRVSAVASGIGGALRNALVAANNNLQSFATRLTEVKVAAGAGAGGGGAASAIDEATTAAERMTAEMNRPLVSAIDGVANAFGNFIAGGLRDFKGFVKSVLQSFQQMLAQMIATALRNRIMIGLGFSGGGLGGTMASAATGALSSGGGFLGGLLGGGGGALGGIWQGLSGIFSGGGLGASFANLGGLISGSVSGWGAVGAALPALGVALGGVGLLIGLFSKKVTELDSGLRVTVSSLNTYIDTFSTIETRRFFGLSRSVSTSVSPASRDIVDPFAAAIAKMGGSVLELASALGVGKTALDAFFYTTTISTKGLSEGDAAKALEAELTRVADAMAATALGAQGLALAIDGETASKTLERLVSTLQTVNGMFDSLGYTLLQASISGADMASKIAAAFGGVDKFSTATNAYYEAFYSEQERVGILTRQLTERFAGLGLVLPATRDGYRALVDAQDLTTEAGRNTFAMLVQMSSAFGLISESADEAASRIERLVSALNPEDFATALDFNRARGVLAGGPSVPTNTPTPSPTPPAQTTQAQTQADSARMDAVLSSINANIALLWKQVQRWDIDGMPKERTE